jgi:hypothetical protein
MSTSHANVRQSPQIQHGRAVNAVAEYLRKTLSVPNIFLEPHIASGLSIDVLAVDHGGGGDLHAVEVKLQADVEAGFAQGGARKSGGAHTTLKEINETHASLYQEYLPRKAEEFRSQLMSLPAHYRYLAIMEVHRDNLLGYLAPRLYSDDGIGRIGLMTLSPLGDRTPEVQLAITPERFRVDPKRIAAIDRFLPKEKPDMEIRL